jgi:1,2-diacylglycerol-3-alpha-glucose alpha-1,2-galactosyltransferase
MMKLHILSETPFIVKGTGVHTAFLDHIRLMKEGDDIDLVVNNEGYGDVLHCHTYGLYYFWKGRRYKGKRVFTVHVIPDSIKGSLPLWKLFMPIVKKGLKAVYSYSDVCIAISPEVERAVIASGAKTRIVKIYNPVHTGVWKRTEEKRIEGRRLMNISKNDFVVIGVGQLQGRKGVEDFIDIAGALPGLKFIWIGGRPFGPLTEGLSRINSKIRNAPANFTYLGQVDFDMMPNIYAAGDLMLFTSYQENCPLAPLEAAASGMPVIFRDIVEYRSLYQTLYLSANDNQEFIFMTERMAVDNNYYQTGLEISSKLVSFFDKDYIRNELMKVYATLYKN